VGETGAARGMSDGGNSRSGLGGQTAAGKKSSEWFDAVPRTGGKKGKRGRVLFRGKENQQWKRSDPPPHTRTLRKKGALARVGKVSRKKIPDGEGTSEKAHIFTDGSSSPHGEIESKSGDKLRGKVGVFGFISWVLEQ